MASAVWMCCAAHGAVIYHQDFESVSTGWSIGAKSVNVSGNPVAIGEISVAAGAESEAAFATHSLKLSHLPGRTDRIASVASGAFNIPLSTDATYEFQFDLRLNRTDVAGYFAISDGAITNQLPMLVQVTKDGRILTGYWNGTGNQNEVLLLQGYAANTTYTFTVTTNPSEGTYSVSVSGGSATMVNQPYRRTVAGTSLVTTLNKIEIYNDGGLTGGNYDMYIDNIQIAVIPEPSMVYPAALGLVFLKRFRRKGVV